MTKKNHRQRNQQQTNDIKTRASVSTIPGSSRDDDRSVEFVLSTQQPVRMYVPEYGEVGEVLLAKGVQLPHNKQVPLLDSHSRYSVDDVLGSVREIRVENGQVVARVFFARNSKAQETYEKVRDGHLTDISVGYSADDSVYVPAEKRKAINGEEFEGPVLVTKKWSLKESSITPIGADSKAKARSEKPENPSANRADNAKGGNTMKTLLALLQQRGLKADASEEETMTFLRGLSHSDQRSILQQAGMTTIPSDEEIRKMITGEIETRVAKRTAEIMDLCRTAGFSIDDAEKYITGKLTVDEIRKEALERLAKSRAPTPAVNVVPQVDEMDKFRAAATDAILLRSNRPVRTPAPGAEDLRGLSVLRLGMEWMRLMGVAGYHRMSNLQIADKLLRLRGEYVIANGTSNFTNILLDAFNKSLQAAFSESPQTWNRWCAVRDVVDFKNINAISLSEAPNLVAINEKGEYTEASFNDRKETYALGTKGLRFTLSRQALVSDDLAAFNRTPLLFGRAAMRYIESAAWGQITANAAMADSYSLFDNTNHRNNPTAAALSSTSLSAAITAMMNQTGFGADSAYIGVVPKFLLVPTDLVWTADIIAGSPNLPEANMPSIPNPAARYRLEVIPSPYLHASSATAWYLLADPNDIPTVELAFLEGTNRSPEAFEKDQVDPDGRVYHVRLDIGADVAAFEGAIKNNGA